MCSWSMSLYGRCLVCRLPVRLALLSEKSCLEAGYGKYNHLCWIGSVDRNLLSGGPFELIVEQGQYLFYRQG